MNGATFDSTGRYRYRLWRVWNPDAPRVCFVMLNPSTADAQRDDPTIRRCVGFARAWGYGGVEVVNLFAFRATRPAELQRAADPVGPGNDAAVTEGVMRAGRVVAAWGVHGALHGRAEFVAPRLGASAVCLGRTQDGHPRHPLYVRGDCALVPFGGEGNTPCGR